MLTGVGIPFSELIEEARSCFTEIWGICMVAGAGVGVVVAAVVVVVVVIVVVAVVGDMFGSLMMYCEGEKVGLWYGEGSRFSE